MQSYVNNRRRNMKNFNFLSRRDPPDDYKENSSPDNNLLISNDYSLSPKTSSSSNIILRLSEPGNYSIEDGTTQSLKASGSSKQKSQNSEKDVIVISDSSDDGNFLKKPTSRFASDNFKKINTSIYISSSSDESDEGDDFILKYSEPQNIASPKNVGKRRISNNFKTLTNFRQRCSILYTSDDTASTASSKSKSSSSKKSKVSKTSSISHVSPTPQDNLTKDRPLPKPLDSLKNPTSKATSSPSFCSTKYQKLFPRKIQKPVSRLSKAEALKILKIVKSKSLNYFSASDSEKSQISDSPGSRVKNQDRGNNFKSNIIEETASEKSKLSNSRGSQKSNYTEERQKNPIQKSNIVEETDSEEHNSPESLQIARDNAIKILENPPINQEPAFNNLSARKRKEIAQWLMTNNADSNNDSSLSHISASNRNSLSSGNSSLDRLELNYETPNNREKFLKLNSDKRRNVNDTEPKTPTTSAADVLKGIKLLDTNKRVNVRTPVPKNSLTSSTNEKTTGEKKQTKIDEYLRKTKTISGTPITVIAPRKNTSKTPVNDPLKPEDVRIEDCVDILDKLYGNTWRAKADAILSEPRKKNVVKKDRAVQTERKLTRTVKKLNVESDSEEDIDFKKFVQNVRPALNSTRKIRAESVKLPKTTQSKVLKRKETDDFIDDKSSSDGSVPSSYYTAVSKVKTNILKKKQTDTPGSTATIRARAICDSETDEESSNKESIYRNHDFSRKRLSYSDEEKGSSTSEFDPEDIVEPKTVIKKRPVNRAQHYSKTVDNAARNLVTKKSYSFLASLDTSVPISCVHPDAKVFRENFKKTKEILCQRLFVIYNEKIFDNKLPQDMLIDWSSRMRGTAGFCYNKKSVKSLGTISRSSRIVLSTKVLDRADRLRDTLVHEMCHAATWIINEVSDGHGPIWKGWAKKAMKVFPELPQVSVCHNYKIHTKYTYKCTGCGYSVGRHSKSLNVQLKRCGYCYGKFELFINRTTKSGNVEMKTPARSKDPSAFALFVKENYQNVKQNRRSMKHGEVMKTLGQQFSAIKIAKKQMDVIEEV